MTDYHEGQKVRIIANHSMHGYAIGTEVYLLKYDDKYSSTDTWLASPDPDAEPRWSTTDLVWYVEPEDIEPALQDWEKELIHPGSTDLPSWREVEVGDLVTFEIEGHGGSFNTEVGVDADGDPAVLGVYVGDIPDSWVMTAYEPQTQTQKHLPGTLKTNKFDKPFFLTDKGWVGISGTAFYSDEPDGSVVHEGKFV